MSKLPLVGFLNPDGWRFPYRNVSVPATRSSINGASSGENVLVTRASRGLNVIRNPGSLFGSVGVLFPLTFCHIVDAVEPAESSSITYKRPMYVPTGKPNGIVTATRGAP